MTCGAITKASCADQQPLPEEKELAKAKHQGIQWSRESTLTGVAKEGGSLAVEKAAAGVEVAASRPVGPLARRAGYRPAVPSPGLPVPIPSIMPFSISYKLFPFPLAQVTMRFS